MSTSSTPIEVIDELVAIMPPSASEEAAATPPTGAVEPAAAAEEKEKPVAWAISFGGPATKKKRKVSSKEASALKGGNRVLPAADPTSADAEVDAAPATVVVDVSGMVDPAVAVPRGLSTTRADIAARNHFDLQRFYCMSRPQYKRTCGVSSLTSIWNLLYSVVGNGALPPVSQEEVMAILGFAPPFDQIRWGSFTGNVTLLRWFHAVNKHFGVTGKAYYLWKSHGRGRTVGLSDEKAEALMKATLRNPSMAVIYHCHNHYMVPIGYQEQPIAQTDAFQPTLSPSEVTTHLIIGEVSRGIHTSLHVKKFSDVALDLNCQSPQHFNIRHTEKGIITRNTKRTGGNLHCMLAFRSDVAEADMEQFEVGAGDDDDDEDDDEQDEDDGNDTPAE
jgi:hypothetical protein